MSDNNNIFDRLDSYLKEELGKAEKSFTGWLSVSSALTGVISQSKKAVTELMKVNTALTQIGKDYDRLSKADLTRIGTNAFEAAGRYGKSGLDYISAVKEALSAGFTDAEGFAELSLALQNAGNMSEKTANQYIIAADQAYQLGGNIEKLTALFDGAGAVSNRYSIQMETLTAGMAAAGETASLLGIRADEAAAALGTMISATGKSGTDAADAFTSLLHLISQTSDEENGIGTAGLWKFKDACEDLNVSLKQTEKGVTSLCDPMEVLEDLSAAYRSLDDTDSRKANLLSSFGSSADSAQLEALLQNWDTFEKMQKSYANGAGSMAAEAEKTANSWEGSLNRLASTWTGTIGKIANSDFIVSIVNGLNGALQVLNKISDVIGPLATIGAGAGLLAGFKNTGKRIPVYAAY